MVFSSSKGTTFYVSCISVFTILIFGYLFITFKYPSIGADSGYYLKIAYDLAGGISFFKDLNCGYSPLAMYIYSLLFYFNKDIGLSMLFVYAYLIYPLIGFFFYKILAYFDLRKDRRLFFTLILITVNFTLEGFHILLEPYVLLFQLIALSILLKHRTNKWMLLLSGMFVFFAFFSKQYGLFIFPAFIYFLYNEAKNRRNFLLCVLFLCAGFLIPLIVLGIYFVVLEQLTIQNFIYRLFGVTALKGDEHITGIGYSLKGLLERLWQFVLKFPFIIMVLLVLVLEKRKISFKKTRFSLLLLLGSLTQLYFAYYDHYFQLITPYVIIAVTRLYKKGGKNNKYRILQVFTFFFIVVSFSKLYNNYERKKGMHAEQSINIPILKSVLKENEKVYLYSISPSYYFLCKYDSPNPEVLGYKFPNELTKHKIQESLKKETYIVIDPKFVDNEFKDYQEVSKLTLKRDTKKGLIDTYISVLKK